MKFSVTVGVGMCLVHNNNFFGNISHVTCMCSTSECSVQSPADEYGINW